MLLSAPKPSNLLFQLNGVSMGFPKNYPTQTRLFCAGKLYHGTLNNYPPKRLECWKIGSFLWSLRSIPQNLQEWHAHAQCLASATAAAIAYQSSTVCSVAADLGSLLGLAAVTCQPSQKKERWWFLEDPTKYWGSSSLKSLEGNRIWHLFGFCSFTQGLVAWFFSEQAVFPVALLVIGSVFFLHWVPKHLDLKDW